MFKHNSAAISHRGITASTWNDNAREPSLVRTQPDWRRNSRNQASSMRHHFVIGTHRYTHMMV